MDYEFPNDRATSPTPAPYPRPPGRQRKLKNKSPFPTQPIPSTGTTSAPATRPREKPPVHHKRCLKVLIEDACLVSAGRLFQSLAPRKEKHFCPLADVFIGSLKSVAVFRRLRELQAEFLVKRLRMYCGASPLRDLQTIDLDSSSTSSRIVFQPRLTINGLLRESKLLFVTILEALF